MSSAKVWFQCEGRRLMLWRETSGFLGIGKPKREPLPVSRWATACPEQASESLAQVFDASQRADIATDGAALATAGDHWVEFHPELLETLPPSDAIALNLPSAIPLTLNLTARGLIHQAGFAIDIHWSHGHGAKERVTEVDGLFRHDGRLFHLPKLFSQTLQAVDSANAAETMSARVEALAQVRAIVEQATGGQIAVDAHIGALRMTHAAGCSLKLAVHDGVVDFHPVLFSRSQLVEALHGPALDETWDSLFQPDEARAFAEVFHRRGAQDAYLLSDGNIVAIDPVLVRVLAALRQAQLLSPDDRRAFALAPRSTLAQACGLSPRELDGLFVDTTQYIQAVVSLDSWRCSVQPWIIRGPAGQWPVRIGLRLDDGEKAKLIELSGGRAPLAFAAIDLALAGRRSTADVAGVTVPATIAARSAAESLTILASADPTSQSEQLGTLSFLELTNDGAIVGYGPLSLPVAEVPTTPPIWPMAMVTSPAPHQQAGMLWLANHWQAQSAGAILADSRGLGTIFQTLGFMVWLQHQTDAPCLIVAPAESLVQWQTQVDLHCSPSAFSSIVRVDVGSSDPIPPGPGLAFTTHETLRDFPERFTAQAFSVVAVDQAGALQGPATQLVRAARMIEARLKVALISPPLAGEIGTIAALLALTKPGYAVPPGSSVAEILHDLLIPDGDALATILRRSRADCSHSLTVWHVHATPMAMPPTQRQAYERLLHRILPARDSDDLERKADLLEQLDSLSLAALVPGQSIDDLTTVSGRIAALQQPLRSIRQAEEKAVILCDDAAIRRRLHSQLEQWAPGLLVIDACGNSASLASWRAATGFAVLLIDNTVLGTGPDLAAGNHLLLLTRPDGPASLANGLALMHHLGQTRPVHVYQLQSVHPDPALAQASFDVQRDRRLIAFADNLALAETFPPLDSLFAAVVVELPEEIEATASAPHTPPVVRKGGRLGPVTPVQPRPQAPAWPTRVELVADRARDLRIFTAPLAGDPVRALDVIDPYAAAGAAARRNTAQFLRTLVGDSKELVAVRLTTFNGEGYSRDDPEDDRAQIEDMIRQWKIAFPNGPDLTFRPQSRRVVAKTLHDRSIKAITRNGRTLIWDLGRGIDGVMKSYVSCTVTLTEL